MVVKLNERSLTLFVLVLILGFLSTIVVTLRCSARRKIRAFALDDWLMLVAQSLFIATCIATSFACFHGIGQRDRYLTEPDKIQGRHGYNMFTYFYIVALVFIKSSICVGLIRIAVQRPLAIALYIVLGLSIVSGFITEVTLLNLCHPITAGWDPDHAGGFCAPMNVLVGVSYFISVMSIITDFSCSIIPSIILWKLQMKRRLKLTVSAIPSLGFLASLATIFRLQYFHSYTAKVDFLYRLTDIAAWSIVESGVGIIAGSMPALKPLIRNCSTVFGPDPTPQAYPHSEPTLHNSNRNCFMLNKLAPSQDRDHYTSKITSNRCLGDDAAESQKDILPSQGIMVREEVDVEEEYYHDGGKDPQVLVCEDFAEAKRREDPY